MSEHGDCQEALHAVYHFLDGELTADKKQVIKQHLDECSPCLEAFDFEAELREIIAHRCRETVPEHLRDRIAQALKHEELHPSADA